jgi:hypothetical protein
VFDSGSGPTVSESTFVGTIVGGGMSSNLPPTTTTMYSFPGDGGGINGYWQWMPYQQPYTQPMPAQHVSYDFGISQKLKLAIEIVKTLPADDPLAVVAREAIAIGLK